MKRWYICPKPVWEGPHPAVGVPHYCLMAGSSYVELDADHLLVCTDFTSEWAEAEWHSHPEVARLAHPQLEASIPLAHLHQREQHGHKQFQRHHHDKLQALAAAHGFALNDTHTLWDLHNQLAVHYPGLRLTRY